MLGHFNAIIGGCVIHAYMSIRRERNRGLTEKPEIPKSRAPSIQSRVVNPRRACARVTVVDVCVCVCVSVSVCSRSSCFSVR